MPDICLDNFDYFVTEAISAARIAQTAIGDDVVPYLPHLSRPLASATGKSLTPEKLFKDRTLVDLEILTDEIERLILKGTSEETVFDNSPECVSSGFWTRRTRTEEAATLARALTVIVDLHETLQVVHDLLAARRVIERMHSEP